MTREDLIRNLQDPDVLSLAVRAFQVAENALGISKPMSAGELEMRAEQIKILAAIIKKRCKGVKVGVLEDAALQAALKSKINHVTPALFDQYFSENKYALLAASTEPVLLLPEPEPVKLTDDQWLAQLPAQLATLENAQPGERFMFELLLAAVYFPALVRLGLASENEANELAAQIAITLPPPPPAKGPVLMFRAAYDRTDCFILAKVEVCKNYHKTQTK